MQAIRKPHTVRKAEILRFWDVNIPCQVSKHTLPFMLTYFFWGILSKIEQVEACKTYVNIITMRNSQLHFGLLFRHLHIPPC